jgi:pimeloyl-ACP methyl ester carboxylesterase
MHRRAVSAIDLAILAADVYDREGTSTLASAAGWRRRDPKNFTEGFAAGTYDRDGIVVVAFRGTETDDSKDLLTDATMVPLCDPAQARGMMDQLFRQYQVTEPSVLTTVAPRVLDAVLSARSIREGIAAHANQVPNMQLHDALSYVRQLPRAPQFVAGHSLGGALAQCVALQRTIPGISFNGPFMGNLRGAVPQSSASLLYINTIGDPLSFATKAVGNLPQAGEIAVQIPPFSRRAPTPGAPAEVPWWRRVAMPFVAALESGYHEFDRQRRFHAELVGYLGEIMLYHHSMANLLQQMRGSGRFAAPLNPRFMYAIQ